MKVSELKRIVECIAESEGSEQEILAIYNDRKDYSSIPGNNKLFGALCVCPSDNSKLGDYKAIQYVKTNDDRYGESISITYPAREELLQSIRRIKE